MKKHLPRILLSLAVLFVFLVHGSEIFRFTFLSRMDSLAYDYRLIATMPRTLDDRVVIVDIDEQSLAKYGRWPWSRDKVAKMVSTLLDQHKVQVIGFDVVFAERDESSGFGVLQKLATNELKELPGFADKVESLRGQLNYDAIFAQTIRGKPVVLGYYFSGPPNSPKAGKLPRPVATAQALSRAGNERETAGGYGASLAEFVDATGLAGHFNPAPDVDGVSRKVTAFVEHDSNIYDPLSLAMVRQLIGAQAVEATLEKGAGGGTTYQRVEELILRGASKVVRIPVDNRFGVLVPYRGLGGVAGGSFRYVSAASILDGTAKPEHLKNKIILVGTTAPGLLDLRSTPVQSVYPGVEIHANLVAGMLDGSLKEEPSYKVGAEIAQLLLVGLILLIALPLLTALSGVILTGVLAVIVVVVNVWFFKTGLVFPLAPVLAMILCIFLVNMSYGYFIESKGKRELAGLFGSYVPPELVDEMAKDPTAYSMEGRSAELTVMFSDVRGFTTISESLSPQDLREYINEYLTSMSLIIQKQRGTLDKYIGDCIMAFWGAPLQDDQHAKNALITALKMQEQVVVLNEKFKARNWPVLGIGIGLNTGTVSVGDMGSKIRKAYTVMGDTVNAASRFEGITKEYGVIVAVGEQTRKAVPDAVYRELDRVRVKGKEEAVGLYEPLGLQGEVAAKVMDELKLWGQALKQYRAQDWDQAELTLFNLQRMSPETKLYKRYAERVAFFRHNPPGANWDGVWKFETK